METFTISPSKRTLRRYRKKEREGVVVSAKKGSPLGRRRFLIERQEAEESLAFVLAVLAQCEAGCLPTSANLKTYPSVNQRGVNSCDTPTWRRPSEKVVKKVESLGYNPMLLGVSMWNIAQSIKVDKPHGNRSAMRNGRVSLRISKETENSPFDRLSKDGKKLVRFAHGVDPIRESGVRRQVPPRNLLNISRRMMHYWKNHTDYSEATGFLRGLAQELVKSSHNGKKGHSKGGENVKGVRGTK